MAQKEQRKEHVVGDVSDVPEGTHKVVSVGRREIGVLTQKASSMGCPTSVPTRQACCARASRPWAPSSPTPRATGSSSGCTTARSWPAPGTASSTTSRPADASRTPTSTCAPTKSSPRMARSRFGSRGGIRSPRGPPASRRKTGRPRGESGVPRRPGRRSR